MDDMNPEAVVKVYHHETVPMVSLAGPTSLYQFLQGCPVLYSWIRFAGFAHQWHCAVSNV
jgi:hypothetical protein